jgi:predicted DCC family thiol-disulfide oxidoreductase YuxK
MFLRKHSDPARLILVDISAADFNAEERTGRSLEALQARLHSHDASGQWFIGLDATQASWLAGGFAKAAWLLGWPPIRWLLLPCYRLFAMLRPSLHWLPHPEGAARCTERRCEVTTMKSNQNESI